MDKRTLTVLDGRLITIDLSQGLGDQYDPLQGHTSDRELHKLAKHLVYDPHDKETIFSDRGAKMVTQIFLAVIELEERPLPYLASLINLGVNGGCCSSQCRVASSGTNVSRREIQARERL
jgi:hypothetical protein